MDYKPFQTWCKREYWEKTEKIQVSRTWVQYSETYERSLNPLIPSFTCYLAIEKKIVHFLMLLRWAVHGKLLIDTPGHVPKRQLGFLGYNPTSSIYNQVWLWKYPHSLNTIFPGTLCIQNSSLCSLQGWTGRHVVPNNCHVEQGDLPAAQSYLLPA